MKEIKDFYDSLNNIKYGWHDKQGRVFTSLKDGNFTKNFWMQKVSNIKKSGYAICWEMCELERDYFKSKQIDYKTIFALSREDNKYFCHTFLIFKYDNSWYWFESSWERMKGIHQYKTIDEILNFIRNHFSDFVHKKNYDKNLINFYEYKKPYFIRRCHLFYVHCMHGMKIENNEIGLY